MNLENSVKDVITKKLEEGVVERLIAEQLEKGISEALRSLLRSYGDVTKIIEKEIKSVMIPYLEGYDYSQYITKLDSVLVEVLESSALGNKKLLENFKSLMIPEAKKEMKVTELFEIWKRHVAEEVDTSDLEIYFGDNPTYEDVNVTLEVEYGENRSWSDFERATIVFECEKDKNMNREITVSRYRESRFSPGKWTIDGRDKRGIASLRFLDELEVLLMQLEQMDTEIVLDSDFEEDEVEVEKEPEADFS